MRHALGGKRVRPVLCLATGEALGGAAEQLLPAAAAIELVHSFSLVHDDLPSLDDDRERRGAPSVWAQLRRGDRDPRGRRAPRRGLSTRALLRHPAVARELVDGTLAMIGGQWLDIRGDADREELHRLKTGALFSASVGCALAALDVPAPSSGRGGRSPPSSGCSSRSSTTSSTATASCSTSAPTARAGSLTARRSARWRDWPPSTPTPACSRNRRRPCLPDSLSSLSRMGSRVGSARSPSATSGSSSRVRPFRRSATASRRSHSRSPCSKITNSASAFCIVLAARQASAAGITVAAGVGLPAATSPRARGGSAVIELVCFAIISFPAECCGRFVPSRRLSRFWRDPRPVDPGAALRRVRLAARLAVHLAGLAVVRAGDDAVRRRR